MELNEETKKMFKRIAIYSGVMLAFLFIMWFKFRGPKTEEWNPGSDHLKAIKKLNLIVPKEWNMVAGNKAHPDKFPKEAFNSDLHVLTIIFPKGSSDEGKVEWEEQKMPFTTDAQYDVWNIFKKARKKGVIIYFKTAYRDLAMQDVLKKKYRGVGVARLGTSSHMYMAFDFSKFSKDGRTPLTLDLKGNVIWLKDLKKDTGKERFSAIIARIYPKLKGDTLSKKIAWHLNKINYHIRTGLWGAHNAILPTLNDYNWTAGHCSEAKIKGANEVWHAQPIVKQGDCHLYNKIWVKNFKSYIKKPGIREGWLNKMSNSLKWKNLENSVRKIANTSVKVLKKGYKKALRIGEESIDWIKKKFKKDEKKQ